MAGKIENRAAMSLALLFAVLGLAPALRAQEPIPILLDTDIGAAMDDAYALALALQSPRFKLLGVTTVHGDTATRATLACRFLEHVGRPEVPVAAGKSSRQISADLPPYKNDDYAGQMQYGLRPGRKRPLPTPAVEFLFEQFKAQPGKITLVAVGPLTNVADLLRQYPEAKAWIPRIVVMGGSLEIGYSGKAPAEPEWNIKSDIAAAQSVLASGIPIDLVPVDATVALKLEPPRLEQLLQTAMPIHLELRSLHELSEGSEAPTLFDPAALIAMTDAEHNWTPRRVVIDEMGSTRIVPGESNVRVASALARDVFFERLAEQLRHTPASEAPGAGRPPIVRKPAIARIESRGKFPPRVHVVEDYETDIERRWWLAGTLETSNVPPGSTRACRGVLCHDFDDRQGDPAARYRAVIFNPVPGPPMGKNTRLSFRYFLRGKGLRVQIYSLTNGYHRQMQLEGLEQGRWAEATVDLTQARRPDGSGGPLSADERIDDIQFYADADSQLLIDDIVLYDAAAEGESRPFPKPLFTAWFDTGKQGVEWPGQYEIVPHQAPLTWKAARAVQAADPSSRVLRIGLRGPRPLPPRVQLSLKYKLEGASEVRLELATGAQGKRTGMTLTGLERGNWNLLIVDLSDIRPANPVDELVFTVPGSANLLVDDVLLFEPASP